MIAEMTKTSPVEVPTELLNKFKRLHPGHGSWTWFVRTALERYVALHDIDNEELLRLALEEINIKNS